MAILIIALFVCFCLSVEIASLIEKIARFKKINKESVFANKEVIYHPFVVSEYLSRIEQEHVKILQEREVKETYTIILWIGLDGLRINDDGILEWITKKEKEKKENNITPIRQDLLEQYIQQCCCTQSQPFPFGYSATSICQTRYQIGIPPYYPYYYTLPQYQRFYPFMPQMQSIESQIREQTQQIDQNIRTLKMQLLQQEMNNQIINLIQKIT